MGRLVWALCISCLLSAGRAEAQWADAKLIASQVGFNVAVSFFGKLIVGHEPAGRAFKQALKEGAVSGAIAHTGYSIVGTNANLALLGKALAQKSALTTRRSANGLPVFDQTLYRHWEITHSFVHLKITDEPEVQIDLINAVFSAYYLSQSDQYKLNQKQSLLGGSLVFHNRQAPPNLRGYFAPGIIWVDPNRNENNLTLRHELVHSLQGERGSSINEWNVESTRINWLVFTSGVPAILAGWPQHDDRLHEVEADRYSGTR